MVFMKRKKWSLGNAATTKRVFTLWDTSGLPAVPNRRLIKDFLIPALDQKFFGRDLEWVDSTRTSFRVLYHHKNANSWSKESAKVFQAWDLMKDRLEDGEDDYFTKARQRFKAALQKCRVIVKTSSPLEKHLEVFRFKTNEERKKGPKAPVTTRTASTKKTTSRKSKSGRKILSCPVKKPLEIKREHACRNTTDQDDHYKTVSHKYSVCKLPQQLIASCPLQKAEGSKQPASLSASEAPKLDAGCCSVTDVSLNALAMDDNSSQLLSVSPPAVSSVSNKKLQDSKSCFSSENSVPSRGSTSDVSYDFYSQGPSNHTMSTFNTYDELDEYLFGHTAYLCGSQTTQTGKHVHHN